MNKATSTTDMIASLERQIALKEAYLPTLNASTMPEHMKQSYRLGIDDMKANLEKFKKIAGLYK